MNVIYPIPFFSFLSSDGEVLLTNQTSAGSCAQTQHTHTSSRYIRQSRDTKIPVVVGVCVCVCLLYARTNPAYCIYTCGLRGLVIISIGVLLRSSRVPEEERKKERGKQQAEK
jgi:hypothetical protein